MTGAHATARSVEKNTSMGAVSVSRPDCRVQQWYVRELISVLVSENLLDEAWAAAMADPGQVPESQWFQLIEVREQDHPADVIRPYQDLIEIGLERASDKYRYPKAVKTIRRLRDSYHRTGGGQVGKSRILTPIESAMRFRSPGSLVTTGAWWRTAVTMTIASTTSAVPEAAQATPAARPVAWSSGRMSQAVSTREIWCWGPSRQAWARTTTGTSGRMRALVNSSCRARKSGLCRSAARSAPVS
jgi:hypothetical protein